MKKIVYFLIVFVTTALLTVSCDMLTPEETSFDETLLYGKWQSGTLFYKYVNDGNGTTWDTADDVTEAEAQKFTWTLVKSELTHIHVLEMGGTVPKVYTLTELTDSTLIYHDDFAKEFSFKKVTE
jgi:hypothetical protein